MIEASLLLETPVLISDHLCDAELDAEWRAMLARSKVTEAFLDRKIDAEYYFDWMIQHGYEPEDLIDTAIENLEFAQAEGIRIEL